MRFFRHRSAARSPSRWNGRYYSISVPAPELWRPSRAPRAPSLRLPALVSFWYWNWRRHRPCLVAHRTWQRRYLRAATSRPWLAAFRGELVRRPDLLCGRATRASTYFLLSLSRGELLRSPSAAGIAWVPGVQTWTTFDGTRPYRTGRRCYTAGRRYIRCQANPADGLVKFRGNRGTTRRSARSISST